MKGGLSIPLMSGKCVTALNISNGRRSEKKLINHCDIRDGYWRWAQATQKPSIAMGEREVYCAVACSIEWEEGKRSNG